MASFPQFQKDLRKALFLTFDKKTLDAFGKTVRDRIRAVTSKGQTMADVEGKLSRLAKLKASTKKQKRRRGLSIKSRLRETGAMMRDLSFRSNVRKQTVTVSNKKKREKNKATFAHDGSSNRAKRPFIPDDKLDKKTDKMIEKILVRGLNRALRKLR